MIPNNQSGESNQDSESSITVDPSNPAFAVLVEKRLVDDTQVRVNAVAARPALTPIGQLLLARFDEAA